MSEIEFEKVGNVGIITINRPDARNAVNTAVAQGIEDAIDKVEADDEIWVAILTGATTDKGYIFCAGADLKQMSVDPGGMSTAKGGFGGLVTRERTSCASWHSRFVRDLASRTSGTECGTVAMSRGWTPRSPTRSG